MENLVLITQFGNACADRSVLVTGHTGRWYRDYCEQGEVTSEGGLREYVATAGTAGQECAA